MANRTLSRNLQWIFLSKYKSFHSWKCIWKYHLWNGGHFVQGRGVNKYLPSTKNDSNYLCHHGIMKLYKMPTWYINGLIQVCSISSALSIEILQSCTKPSISCFLTKYIHHRSNKKIMNLCMAGKSQGITFVFSWIKHWVRCDNSQAS